MNIKTIHRPFRSKVSKHKSVKSKNMSPFGYFNKGTK